VCERIAVRAALVPFCLMVGLGGCQSPPTYSGGSSERTAVLHPGDAAVSVVDTPFYLAFKGVTCAMSAVIAAPVAVVTALSESRFAPEIRESLGDGLKQNCGPPYALSPYRVVSVERAPPVPRAQHPDSPRDHRAELRAFHRRYDPLSRRSDHHRYHHQHIRPSHLSITRVLHRLTPLPSGLRDVPSNYSRNRQHHDAEARAQRARKASSRSRRRGVEFTDFRSGPQERGGAALPPAEPDEC
jgi:hypothetical protein